MKKSTKIMTTGILMVLAMFAGCGTAQEASEKSDGQPTATVTGRCLY